MYRASDRAPLRRKGRIAFARQKWVLGMKNTDPRATRMKLVFCFDPVSLIFRHDAAGCLFGEVRRSIPMRRLIGPWLKPTFLCDANETGVRTGHREMRRDPGFRILSFNTGEGLIAAPQNGARRSCRDSCASETSVTGG